jgi:hypothetical protein
MLSPLDPLGPRYPCSLLSSEDATLYSNRHMGLIQPRMLEEVMFPFRGLGQGRPVPGPTGWSSGQRSI